MTLDPETAALLDELGQRALAARPDLQASDIEAAREISRATWLGFAGEADARCRVESLRVDGAEGQRPARLYRPLHGDEVPLPVILFLHGGGWSMGDLDSYDGLMRALCAGSGAIFVSLDFRLAPEHRYPAGLEDGLAAINWLYANAEALGGDPARLAIMGDSSGGNLAAVIANRLRSGQGPALAAQFLIYPVLDVSKPHEAYPSRIKYGGGAYLLGRGDIDTTVAWYLDAAGRADDPNVSPLLAENLQRLPPTALIVAGYDPLRDEARAYADRLEAAGVETHFKCFESTIHAFLSFGTLEVGQEGRDHLCRLIRRWLGACRSSSS